MKTLGRRLICFVLFMPLFASAVPEARAEVIYQAFNEPFIKVRKDLPRLKAIGFDSVQISPPSKSLNTSEWWARYQPVELARIDSPLGQEQDLVDLTEAAHELGMKIIVDLVLNHMADDQTSPRYMHYPEFTPKDFHYPDRKPCIENYLDRYQVTQYWLCDERKVRGLPDLDTSSPHVRTVHKNFMSKLRDLGADGFRFDAAKHIEADYWRDIVAFNDGLFVYGEVIAETFSESYEYTPLMPITDFHLLRTLLGAFSLGGDLRSLHDPEGTGQGLPADKAVVFARNHDTAMHPTFFNFGDYTDAMLANAYLLARGRGVPFIYREDAEHPFVKGGVRFFKALEERPTRILRSYEVCDDESACPPRTTLFIARGSEGFAIINSANAWIDTNRARTPGLTPGCYKDTVYGVSMTVQEGADGQRWISRWTELPRPGIHIGPRSALMFLKAPEKDCTVKSSPK